MSQKRTALAWLALGAASLAAPQPAPVLMEDFSYPVDGLSVRALTCRPDKRAGRPLLNLVHGGLNTPPDKAACQRFARLGYAVAASALRGQGGSGGKVEVCLGEVRDVLALRRLAGARYHIDARRVAYLGVSLGGCTALKAAAQDPGARAVVTLISPTDFARQVKLLREVRPDALSRWEALLGGSPEAAPQNYARRRPLEAAQVLRPPLLTVAAGNDPLIALLQSCEVRDVRRAVGRCVAEVRQTASGAPAPLPDKPWRRCQGEQSAGQLPALRLRDVLLIYSDLDHRSTSGMWRVAEQYLAANIEPPTLKERLTEVFQANTFRSLLTRLLRQAP